LDVNRQSLDSEQTVNREGTGREQAGNRHLLIPE
jgi:hypothetical protein